MSVINKYPFINTLLSSLTSEQLKDLNDCINGQYEGSVVFRTLKSWGNSLLTESDKGIYPIQLELNGPAATTLPGYLVYTDDYCVLISYANDDACKLTIVNITMPETGSDIKWEYVSESLTVNELRSSLFDAAAGEGGGSGGGTKLYRHVIADNNSNVYKLVFVDDVSQPYQPTSRSELVDLIGSILSKGIAVNHTGTAIADPVSWHSSKLYTFSTNSTVRAVSVSDNYFTGDDNPGVTDTVTPL